jgi:hypothetical protein
MGRMLASEQNATVDRAQIFVVLLARLFGPNAVAAERRWMAMPRDRNAVFELLLVLGMNLRTVFACPGGVDGVGLTVVHLIGGHQADAGKW